MQQACVGVAAHAQVTRVPGGIMVDGID